MTKNPLGARLQAVAVLAVAPVLAACAPSPSTSWARLTAASGAGFTAATEPLTAALALAAWACTGWLLVVVLSVGAAGLPGTLGEGARGLAARVAPASVRSLVRVALGGAVVVSVLGGTGSAFADTSYDWPGASVVRTAPSAAPSPSATPAPAAVPARAAAPARAATSPLQVPRGGSHDVVVAPGDSLWSLAAADLGPSAGPHQVAQAWPRWWAANRAVVGDDPALIHPGAHLSAPRS